MSTREVSHSATAVPSKSRETGFHGVSDHFLRCSYRLDIPNTLLLLLILLRHRRLVNVIDERNNTTNNNRAEVVGQDERNERTSPRLERRSYFSRLTAHVYKNGNIRRRYRAGNHCFSSGIVGIPINYVCAGATAIVVSLRSVTLI